MKKFVFIILALVAIIYLFGCGKKEDPFLDMQEPISIDELGKLNTQSQEIPEETSKVEPAAVVSTSAEYEQLPPVMAASSKPTVREIQAALKNAGYYIGLVDGKIGPLTKKAIEDFQKASNLEVDGKVGSKTWALLSAYLNPAPESPKTRKKR
ncbi:MAG: peptidoglycan-binding domain-containing protein [Candidatus Omnitrophota bacterium]